MKVTLSPSVLRGEADAVPSKSHAHRLLIAAALSDAPCKVVCPAVSRDIEATANCLAALGAKVSRTEDGYEVTPVAQPEERAVLDCGESGSTLRFLLPVACALGTKATFTGKGRLPHRPIAALADALRKGGAEIGSDALPLITGGRLTAERFSVQASVSSQYVSGMLFALACTGRRCTLRLIGKPVSEGYTEMTVNALAAFNKHISFADGEYTVPAGRLHSPGTVRAEGDWSSAAFLLAAGALTGDVTVKGLDPTSAQRDRAIADILTRMGARVTLSDGVCRAEKDELRGVSADVEDTPDLAPVLSVLMAQAKGKSVMRGVSRLKDKESDRLAAIIRALDAMGVRSQTDGATLTVFGGGIHPFAANGEHDHRMVMSAAVAGLVSGGSVTDAEAVDKSYPSFFEDIRRLGGQTHESL